MNCSVGTFVSPFGQRPWMIQNGAAASIGGGKSLQGVVIGGITGCIEIVLTYPAEYVKTQLQLDENGAKKRYNGIVDCMKTTVKERGFVGLYTGLTPLLYGSIPKSASRFYAFETLRGYMVNQNGQLSTSGKLLAGLGAGVCEAVVAVTPMQTIKTKFIDDKRSARPQYKGFAHGVGCIIKSEGIRGIYKGLTATVMKQGANQAIRFYVMESLKDLYKSGDNTKNIPVILVGFFGIIAGALSVFGTAPLDVVKTRMQGLEAAKYRNTVHCVIQIGRNEGVGVYFKGTVARLFRACLDVAITFMVYDSFMKFFDNVWKE